MKDNNSKQVLLSVLGVAILVVAVVGVSFAAFAFSQTGAESNTITTGTISMNYDDSEPTINITNALPTNDETGKALSGANNVFNFSVSTTINGTGDTDIDYAITATTTPGTSLTDNFVKVYLTNTNSAGDAQLVAPTLVSSLSKTSSDVTGAPDDQYVIYRKENITSTTTDNYRLRMWVADNYSVSGSQETYKLKVNVYGKAQAS